MSAARKTTVSVEREFPFDADDFAFLARLVHERSGIVLAEHKANMVYSRLARRLRELGLPSFADYCRLVQGPDGVVEMGHLINAITTNLTRFFREPHHFQHLKAVGLPEAMDRNRATRRLRVWSAGCSSGEEPYSIAAVLAGTLAGQPRWDARILATDLDTSMVARGRTGTYSGESLAEAPAAIRDRFFVPAPDEDDVWSASDELRSLLTFKPLNLLGPWPMSGPFDAIFCRNVMIYFDNPTKERLVERFAQLLEPGGYLYIGHSETLLDFRSTWRLAGRTIYQKSAP